MKVFISQPMRGLSDDEIIIVRDAIWRIVQEKHGDDCEIIESWKPHMPSYNPVVALSLGIEKLADADVVYFAPGWDEARGCVVEHVVAELYNIPLVELEDL